MSRVKQPIEDAKEYALQQNNQQETQLSAVVAAPTDSDAPSIVVGTPSAANAAVTLPEEQPLATNTPESCKQHPLEKDFDLPFSLVPSLSLTKDADCGVTTKAAPATFILDADGNPIAYTSEQDTLNLRLRSAVLAVEEDAVHQAETFAKQLTDIKKAMDALNPVRSACLAEYTKIFAWPELPDVAPEALVGECAIESDLQFVQSRAKELTAASESYRKAPGLLDELLKPVNLMRRRAEIQEGLEPVSRLLLNDNRLTEDLIVNLHNIAQGDVFAFTRSELSQKQRELDALREDLTNTAVAKNDALLAGDVRGAETLAFREVDIAEKIIDRLRQRVNIIFQCDSDVKEFCSKYQASQELAETALNAHEAKTQAWLAALGSDVARLSQAKGEATQLDVDDEDAHAKRMEDMTASIRAVHHQQLQNWEKIVELVQFNTVLATQRQRLVTDQIAVHAQEVHRRAKVGAWFAGTDAFLDQLQQAQASASTGLKWISQVRTYVNQLCSQIENKRIDEEAWQMRVQEQLDYLDAYKHYKTLVDDIAHRKELRVMSLHRVVRNLELQIKEAVETLDPNTKKYAAEVVQAKDEIRTVGEVLAELRARAQEEQKLWKLMEESLEESQVDFIPPDIAAEKELCEKKSQALTVARQFVVTEQETVDKDTMRLRKLKTSNIVATEGLTKRRAERAASVLSEHSP